MYFQYTGTTKEDVVAKMNDEAEKRLKARYLLQAIIKEEKPKYNISTVMNIQNNLEELIKLNRSISDIRQDIKISFFFLYFLSVL